MWKRDRWMIARLMALVAVIGATWLVWHGQQLTQAEQGGNIGPPDQLDSVACLDISGSRTGCNAILPAGTHLKGYKLISQQTNQTIAFYDASTMPANDTTKPKDEHSEPTQYDTNIHIYPSPIRYNTGVSVGISGSASTGSVIILYY